MRNPLKAPIELWRILRTIAHHPLTRDRKRAAFGRFLRWQIASRAVGHAMIYPFVNQSRLILSRTLGGGGYVYLGLPEYREMAFLLHFLKPEDHFVDIGAYIGAYTVLASAVCGAKTTAFEPVPSTFARLSDNIRINSIAHRATALAAGAGREDACLPFTTTDGTQNRCLRDGELAQGVQQLPVRQLDGVVGEDFPAALKIDAEGFEHEVLDGASAVLAHPNLQAIIIELWQDRQLHEKVNSHGFVACSYDPLSRSLTPGNVASIGDNAVYVRDIESARRRIADAPKFTVLGMPL